ncbi:glycoside hydrolase family 13 protein [Pseudarthrobacter sp. J1763]|uniref:glycoside hydrolase family 13 protein n=1 Tax=Pseudarthrobacter sp. J1763 TaxID=3420445 RepID=UPI003D26A70D
MPIASASAKPWWYDAVIYQVYPRSYSDANGDGMGDLPGITARLDHLAELGVDAVWLSPFYRSPQADAGYDVADYRQVDPLFGTIDDFDALRTRARELGLRVIVDLVPNHTSDQHVWFQEALAAAPGSPARERYMFRPGLDGKVKGDGALPPNDWQSIFGGPAWTRVVEPDGTPGEWYLHIFASQQPDLNWHNPEVRTEFEAILRFWLDKGVDGFRVDVAHGLIKADGLPNWSAKVAMVEGSKTETAPAEEAPESPEAPPYFDQDGVHEIYRQWHKVLAEYDGDRLLVAEAWVEPVARLMRYVRHNEMQQAFNFGYLTAGWDALRLSKSIDESLAASATVERPTTWVLSNHDSVRHTSRFGLKDPTTYPRGISAQEEQPDEALGLHRGRAASLLMFALPGSAYIYQGEELGLPEHTTLPAEFRQDPSFFRTKGKETGRDGCRVPLPWSPDEPGYGFSLPTPGTDGAATATTTTAAPAQSAAPAEPWLPQPETFRKYAAQLQSGVVGSTLEMYRAALKARQEWALGKGILVWSPLHAPTAGVVSFTNGKLLVLANLGSTAVELPAEFTVFLPSDSAAVSGTVLNPNAAVWLLPKS